MMIMIIILPDLHPGRGVAGRATETVMIIIIIDIIIIINSFNVNISISFIIIIIVIVHHWFSIWNPSHVVPTCPLGAEWQAARAGRGPTQQTPRYMSLSILI